MRYIELGASVLLLASAGLTALAQQAAESGLTARQLFYKEEVPATKEAQKTAGGTTATKTKKVDAAKRKTGDAAGKSKAPDAPKATAKSTRSAAAAATQLH